MRRTELKQFYNSGLSRRRPSIGDVEGSGQSVWTLNKLSHTPFLFMSCWSSLLLLLRIHTSLSPHFPLKEWGAWVGPAQVHGVLPAPAVAFRGEGPVLVSEVGQLSKSYKSQTAPV